MVAQLSELDPAVVEANLLRVREEIARAGRSVTDVEILAAIKYLPPELLPALAVGGVTVVGENRAQGLAEKQAAVGLETFAHWDFIGQLQSRKVKELLGRVRYIHSVASDSALAQLERHEARGTAILVEVNIARDPDKSGIAPAALGAFLARAHSAGVEVAGLMTMPAQTADPESSRPAFATLAELAAEHRLAHLSMGTSQDYRVAVEEGATIIRLGSGLLRSS